MTLFDIGLGQTKLVHNTEFFTAEERESLTINAQKQENRVLEFLEARSDKSFGASKIWLHTKQGNEPITSIRRALTNLEKKGLVQKLSETVKGMFGKSEHTWKITK